MKERPINILEARIRKYPKEAVVRALARLAPMIFGCTEKELFDLLDSLQNITDYEAASEGLERNLARLEIIKDRKGRKAEQEKIRLYRAIQRDRNKMKRIKERWGRNENRVA